MIGFIGAGAMGLALIEGFIKAGINKNTIIKYSFSITIEGVSKDGSKAKATE